MGYLNSYIIKIISSPLKARQVAVVEVRRFYDTLVEHFYNIISQEHGIVSQAQN